MYCVSQNLECKYIINTTWIACGGCGAAPPGSSGMTDPVAALALGESIQMLWNKREHSRSTRRTRSSPQQGLTTCSTPPRPPRSSHVLLCRPAGCCLLNQNESGGQRPRMWMVVCHLGTSADAFAGESCQFYGLHQYNSGHFVWSPVVHKVPFPFSWCSVPRL